jgi:hypothetical protein
MDFSLKEIYFSEIKIFLEIFNSKGVLYLLNRGVTLKFKNTFNA